jgi:hypothetical protein
MATNFPGGIDTFVNPNATSSLDSPSHAGLHTDLGDAMTAVQTELVNNPNGFVHIETQAFSAVSSVNFSNDVFTTDFRYYSIFIDITSGTGAQNGRFRAAGTDYATGTYVRQYLEAGSTTVSAARNTAQTSLLGLSTQDNVEELIILNPKQAKNTRAFSRGGFVSSGNIFVHIRSWDSGTTNSFDSFSLLASSGSISGSMTLYGLKE